MKSLRGGRFRPDTQEDLRVKKPFPDFAGAESAVGVNSPRSAFGGSQKEPIPIVPLERSIFLPLTESQDWHGVLSDEGTVVEPDQDKVREGAELRNQIAAMEYEGCPPRRER